MKSQWSMFRILALVLLVAPMAFGQTTGRLGGTATMDGAGLPGVTVTIASPNLQGTRTTVTDVNGNYTFGALPPGNYTVVFEMESMQGVTRTVDVGVAGTARADATMRLSAVAESITVTASSPAVVETNEIQTNIDSDLVEELPINRTVLGTVNLAPGVNNNGVGNSTVISGAPAYDSTFYIDGAVVNEVLRGQPLDLFIEDALEETTVQTGAISAEFGRFTGGVVTAVTKAGGNEYSGSFRDTFNNPRWTENSPLGEARAEDDIQQTYEATLGGRIIRDRLWFFGAGRYFEQEQPQFYYRSQDLPEGQRTFMFGREQRRLEGKLTGQITPRHTVVGNYLDLQDDQTNNNFGTIWEPSAVDTSRSTPQYKLSGQWNGILSDNLLVEALYTESELRFVNSGGPEGDFASATNVYQWNTNTYLGAPTFTARAGDKVRSTEDLLLKTTYFLSSRLLGTHNIVVGYDDFTQSVLEDNPQSGSDFTVWTFTLPRRDAQGRTLPTFSEGDYIIWFPVLQASQGNDFNTRSVFLNDKWDLNPYLSFNLGVRYDRNEGKDQAGALVADDDTISPRLGVNYDLFGNGRLRFSGSYGKYASKIANGNIGDAASPAGSPSYLLFLYGGETISGLPTTEALQRMWDWFQSVGGVENDDYLGGGGTSGLTARIPDRLVTPNMEEWTIGFSTLFGTTGYFRLDYQDREWHDFYVEEMNTEIGTVFDPLRGANAFVTELRNTDEFVRTYEAVLVQGGYQLTERINLGANYTWSESKGNAIGETSGSGPVPLQGRNFQPELLSYANRTPIGFLPNDQEHKLRAWASYDQPTPFGSFNFSLLGRFDSGTPYSALGGIDTHQRAACPQCPASPYGQTDTSTNNFYYFSKRGEFRWDDVYAADLAVNYNLPLGRANLFVQAEARNVTNEQSLVLGDATVLTARSASCVQAANGPNPGQRCLAFNPFTETPVEGVHWRKGPNFGGPTTPTTFTTQGSYQLPRTYVISAGVKF